ncbi:MAG TPA: hypothetical protein VF195_11460 [Actinomycetota bacterium]
MKQHVRSTLFRSPRSKLLAAGASFAAIALFALILPASVASGQTSASTSTLQNGGVLRLRLGAQDSFRFQVPDPSLADHYIDPSPASTQAVGVSTGCKLSPTSGSLAQFSTQPSNADTGFVGDAIGVRVAGEGNGQPCGRIDAPAQALGLKLGTGLAGKAIDYAEIDIEGKFSANFRIDGYFVTGACPPPTGTPTVTTDTYNTAGSDSGPDSGDGDNYRIRFPQSNNPVGAYTAVNCLVFTPITGAASLEGGSDGTTACDATDVTECGAPVNFSLGEKIDDTAQTNTSTTDSLFHLINVDGVLDCNANTFLTQTNAGITTDITRLNDGEGNNPDGSTCIPIPVDQDSSTTTCGAGFRQCIFLQKDLLDPNAQFEWTVTWAAEPGFYMESETQFDFGNGNGLNDLLLCQADGLAGNGFDGNPDLPANDDPWCVKDTSTALQISAVDGQTYDQVTETYYGLGDPLGKRG